MPKDAPNSREDAYAVMKYLASPEVSLDLVTDTRTHLDPWRYSHFVDPSKYTGLWETGAAEEFAQKSLEAIDKGMQFHIKRAYTYQDILGKYISKALAGEMDAEEAVDACAAEWDRLTEDIGQDYMTEEIRWYHELLRERGYLAWMRQADWTN
jgi:multiple sugar transport system substrate-binding protein